jgi:hypothetical protein
MNQSPEALAIQVCLPEVASVLSAVVSPSSKLIRAVVDLDPDAVKNQLEQMQSQGSLAAAINGKGRDGLSALHHACKVGFLAGHSEFTQRHTAFGFETHIDDGMVIVDCGYGAFYDAAFKATVCATK